MPKKYWFNDPDSQLGQAVVLLLFCVPWSAITLMFDFSMGKVAFQQIYALTYPTTLGSVTRSEVAVENDGDGPSYAPKIAHTYSVAGKKYEGSRYRYGQIAGRSDAVRGMVASLPVGSDVVVHYAPNDPSDAVLRSGVEGGDLIQAIFSLPFNLVMLGLWLAIRYRVVPAAAGGARICEDGRYIRVQLFPWLPLWVAAIAAGAMAFVLAFVFGLGIGTNPPVWVALAAWGILFAGSAAVYRRVKRKLLESDPDLVIDTFGQSITLPRSSERQDDVIVPWAKIVSIDLKQEVKPGTESTTGPAFIPTLVFIDSDRFRATRETCRWEGGISIATIRSVAPRAVVGETILPVDDYRLHRNRERGSLVPAISYSANRSWPTFGVHRTHVSKSLRVLVLPRLTFGFLPKQRLRRRSLPRSSLQSLLFPLPPCIGQQAEDAHANQRQSRGFGHDLGGHDPISGVRAANVRIRPRQPISVDGQIVSGA